MTREDYEALGRIKAQLETLTDTVTELRHGADSRRDSSDNWRREVQIRLSDMQNQLILHGSRLQSIEEMVKSCATLNMTTWQHRAKELSPWATVGGIIGLILWQVAQKFLGS